MYQQSIIPLVLRKLISRASSVSSRMDPGGDLAYASMAASSQDVFTIITRAAMIIYTEPTVLEPFLI